MKQLGGIRLSVELLRFLVDAEGANGWLKEYPVPAGTEKLIIERDVDGAMLVRFYGETP